MRWRPLSLIACLLMVHAAVIATPVHAAPPGGHPDALFDTPPAAAVQEEDTEVFDLPTVVSVPKTVFDAVGSDTLEGFLKARAKHDQAIDPDRAAAYAKGLDKDLKAVKTLGRISKALNYLDIGLDALPGAIRAWNAAENGEWREAAIQAAGVAEMIGKGLLKNAASKVAANYATLASYAACAAFNLGAPVCIGVILVARYAAKEATKATIDWILEPFETPFCRNRRTGNAACEPSPILVRGDGPGPGGSGADPGGAGAGAGPGGPSTASAGVGRHAGQGPPSAPGFTGGGGVKLGSTTTTVTAKNLTAGASGSGSSAVNNIGSISGGGGGGANVSVQSITTVAKGGQSATTNIGSGGGDTVVTGDTYNEGGDLTIGSGRTSRDGRTCIDVYRNTCIVRIYYRKHYSDPCAPGYWRVLNACKLPSDDKHSIPGL